MHVEKDRVLFVLTALHIGGAEMLVLELMRAMQRLGWRPALVALAGGPLEERVRAAGFPLRVLSGRIGVHDPKLVVELAQAYRDFRPAVVHSHTAPANLLARAARLLCWVPRLVSTAHNVHEGKHRHLFYRATDRLASITTNVSQAAARRYIEIGAAPAHRMLCVPNAIDTVKFTRSDAGRGARRDELRVGDAFVWLAVGRLQRQKAYPRMIDAFELHLQSWPNDRLCIVGTGELEDELRARIEGTPLADRVQLLGRRMDVAELMSAADAYLMSSDWEGMPIVLLEAASCQLPAVVTDVGGNAELVHDGETGVVVPASTPEVLAAGMTRMRSLSASERSRMGARAREHVVGTYSMDVTAARWDAIYRGSIPPESRMTGDDGRRLRTSVAPMPSSSTV